ncbi:putative Fork head protein like protein [Glarea lozoyensis 74030]|uniref:Putative Fork head protein like protein n=1 Tax=Glarea lozoyensis (strain ATCC 74030 / MF5533) TaxID=1104152 RepID=H0ETQ8_GLAL7|nr:putative Fork head protein like protein [Glarea lozoyensis 74030]
MPPSTKRSNRARKEIVNHDGDVPDSSPSRPTKRRKKEKIELETELESAAPEPARLPLDRDGIALSDDELVATIVPHLQLPDHPVQACQDHANALYEKHNKEGVQAYAKLAGKDWTFYVKNLNNVIGRPPEGAPAATRMVRPDGTGMAEGVHIDLGPSKMVSRLHAEIFFDSNTELWNVHVQGRNGIKVNDKPRRKGEKIPLVSGHVIEIAGIEMMFVLPVRERSLHVDNKYLLRAGLIQGPEEDNGDETEAPASSQTASGNPRGHIGSGPLPIAPAPPNYQRPGTPLSARSKADYANGKSSYPGGAVMNSENVDLSLEKHHTQKPSFSYAQMIAQAILSTETEQLNLSGIYSYIQDSYSYYRHQNAGGWQNSIRHNLSLNKAFIKIARSTDEPGKGMKWCIVPECREEMVRNAWKGGRGGHRGSSAPNSPANQNSITRVTKDDQSSSMVKPKRHSPRSKSPLARSFMSNVPQFTPDRRGPAMQDNIPGDGSPLPRHRRPAASSFGLSDNAPGSPPTMSSSYLQEDAGSMVTPAPSRVHPRLAPPSTAQRPSQHMPTSSPAPFWNSPPPPHRASAVTPTRTATIAKLDPPAIEEPDEEEGGFDLTRGFQTISSYHAGSIRMGFPVTPAVNGQP